MELLAPAGTKTSLHAAVKAGANAVYLGLEDFNARRNAENFTLEDLAEACRYAHLRGVKIYVTMNVEILPGEMTSALALVKAAQEAGADAFIFQDVGLINEVRRNVPAAHIHLSTQMNIHNSAGIGLAAALGAKRITLGRELSLPEISALCDEAHELGIEVECFGHGAICVSYSGKCLMSSMIGGRSANRGLCAQPCRLPYELKNAAPLESGKNSKSDQKAPLNFQTIECPGDHLLSPKDLCTIDYLEQLKLAGVDSLKIEGRMKSADYVYEVVSVYREALDEANCRPVNIEESKSRLAEAFSRGFTADYLLGKSGNELMSYKRPNNRGVFAGRIVSIAKNSVATIKAEIPINAADLLEVWTNKGRFCLDAPKYAAAGDTFEVSLKEPASSGDRLFRVRNSQRSFEDIPFEPRIPIEISVDLRRGHPARLEARDLLGHSAEVWGDRMEPARSKEITVEEVKDHINRLGQTPFVLLDDGIQVNLEPGLGMSFSKLHHLRADALKALEQEILNSYNDTGKRARKSEAESEVKSGANSETKSENSAAKLSFARPAATSKAPIICAWACSPSMARALGDGSKGAGAQRVYVPLLNFRRGQNMEAGAINPKPSQAGYPKECIMALPVISHDCLSPSAESRDSFDMWEYVREDKLVFADNLSDGLRALSLGARVEIGPHVPIVNKESLQLLAQWGFERVWLSSELSLGQIASLAENPPIELGIFVAGAQELMVTEHCLLTSQGPCNRNCHSCERRQKATLLVDRKGFDFPVFSDMYGRSHVYNGIELDSSGAIADLLACGISAFMVDSTLMTTHDATSAVKRVIKAVDSAMNNGRAVDKRPGTTTGHLHRGVA